MQGSNPNPYVALVMMKLIYYYTAFLSYQWHITEKIGNKVLNYVKSFRISTFLLPSYA
jgi:hypothetical protein